jgi:hypothetical protein
MSGSVLATGTSSGQNRAVKQISNIVFIRAGLHWSRSRSIHAAGILQGLPSGRNWIKGRTSSKETEKGQ